MPNKLNLLNLNDAGIRTLHMAWFAFFLTFVMWFNHAPLVIAIRTAFDLSDAQWKALLMLNVAMTIPARVIIGILVDRFGPRHVFSLLLVIAGLLCAFFALAQSYNQLALARFLMGFVGAGFVIGIRLVGEWFPAKQVGLAEGIYGGWGNFGSAAAAMTLPTLALIYGGENGWRLAVLSTGTISVVYGIIFFKFARNTPKGSTYFKPKKSGGLEVTSRKDFYFLLGMNVPMYLALGVLAWRLSPTGVGLLSQGAVYAIYAGLLALYAYQASQIYRVNKDMLRDGVDEIHHYEFKQVAILNVSYFVTFGSELAVVSMLPAFFIDTFGLSPVKAGLLASGFAFMNLVARPTGGLVSDKFGRRKSMIVLILGLAVGYLALSQVNSSWPVFAAVTATMMCSFFVQSGEGAVFAMVPLVKRRMTGQIAGMTGAYGNVGAVCFLTIYSFVDASTFFMVIGFFSLLALGASVFLAEPKGHTAEVMPDGSVQYIKVS
ncbi:NarK family nitrate/nitrite MFS transporter [Cerasicoccus fimbriatus]|uniref:NarK family nitrate/nitrite MFS transporter n=1 Tax=Cerasicoccus fimbriatus TaxID=3014554 RepID=UPI0022B4C01E|nr:NarK family nitrate/nitrite MFS transporter [Cerasicoccus sp. TK19100]